MFALDRSWSGLAINLSASLGQLAAAGLLISWDVSEVDDVFATIAGVQGFVITLALMTLRFRWRSLHYLLLLVRQHWTFSRWLMASTIASWLAGNSYLFVAGALIGTDAVGVFRAVQNILSVFNLFLLALRNVAPVQFAKKMKAEGIAVVMAFGVRVSLILFGLFVLAGAPLIIFPSAVLDLVYGNADVSAYGWLLQLMLLLPLLSAVDYGLREAVYVSQRGQYLFGAYVLVAIINITTANFVVAQWGLQGVALGMVVSQFVIVGALIVALLTSLRLGR
jgi:O-antigen/teichoic acid export membrane protein